MNAITLLKQDHKIVQELFARYEQCSPDDADQKKMLVEKIIRELSVHAAIEEQVFYPMVRKEVDGATDQVLESLEEHHVVKWLLSELDGMTPSDERYDAKMSVLMESVRHHIEEEEGDMFPKVSKLGRNKLDDIGKQLDAAKASAPTTPMPRAPDSPPANLVMNPAAGMLQKAATRIRGAGQKVVSALNRRSGVNSTATSKRASKNTSKPSGASRKSARKPSGTKKTATRKSR